MDKRTLICAYGRGEDLEEVFERLQGLYLTNFDRGFAFCALIDLPEAISYRVSGDAFIEERVQHLTRELNRGSGNAFFALIRQRRFAGSMESRIFACEGGEKGALEALWRFVNGKTSVLFPIFGGADIEGVEQVYFSGSMRSAAGEFINLIEPGGIGALCAAAAGQDAVFAVAGAMFGVFLPNGERFFEGLYTASGLDKQLCCGEAVLKTSVASGIGMTSYPRGSLFVLDKSDAVTV